MYGLTLSRVNADNAHPVIAAYKRDYGMTDTDDVFIGTTQLDELVVAFILPDGAGIVLVSREPDDYTRLSEALASNPDYDGGMSGAPDETELDPGSFDHTADEITLDTVAGF